jgi:hypothetical protein
MKVRLLDPGRDTSLQPWMPPHLREMIEDDLELRTVYSGMADGDEFLYNVAKKVVPLGVTDPVVIEYRQDVLADCMANPAVVQQMYDIAVDAVHVRRKVFLGGLLSRDPQASLHNAARIPRVPGGEPQTATEPVRPARRRIPVGRVPAIPGDDRRPALR